MFFLCELIRIVSIPQPPCKSLILPKFLSHQIPSHGFLCSGNSPNYHHPLTAHHHQRRTNHRNLPAPCLLHDQTKDGLSQRRPWSELVDRSTFSKPESISDATANVRNNYSYFDVNCLVVVTTSSPSLSSPMRFSLITLVVILAS